MKNWPHQDYVLAELDKLPPRSSVAWTTPTGGGKTNVLFQDVAKDNAECAIYTDRKMLFNQLADEMEQKGMRFGCRAAGRAPRLLERVQLCMVQTEVSRVLKGRREVHAADRIYIDEAHKNSGDGMQRILAKHRHVKPNCSFILVTATPLGIGHIADRLIVAGTNSELRDCGALVPAYHFGPDEPDTKWVGKVAVGEGECGLALGKRMEFATRVFGPVVGHYRELNPQEKSTILFAPGVKESLWFAQKLTKEGITAVHIDGNNVWLPESLCDEPGGHLYEKDDELVRQVAAWSKSGRIKVVCNRFVLREGINWPWVCHGIFATVFGSLTSYIQAGGRLLRAYPGKDCCTIQDHGGNWWRHGSLNTNREWNLEYNDRIEAGLREQRIRENKEPEPIVCPKCHAIRISGPDCKVCGFRYEGKSRMVLQKDGTLREMKGDIFRKRRVLTPTEELADEWRGRIRAVMRSQKATVMNATPAQLEVWFARDHNWQYPPRSLPMMPVNEMDWFRPIREVTEWTR